jgi:hypothetical protein
LITVATHSDSGVCGEELLAGGAISCAIACRLATCIARESSR